MIAPVLALILAGQASMPAEANEATSAVAQCVVAEANARASGPASAEAVADAAEAACAESLQLFWGALGRTLGELSEAERRRLIAPLHDRLIRLVNVRRGLVPRQENEATAVGDCIRTQARDVAARAGPAETLVNVLVEQCRTEIDALRAYLVREHGEGSADRIMPGVLVTMRAPALQQIQQARAVR